MGILIAALSNKQTILDFLVVIIPVSIYTIAQVMNLAWMPTFVIAATIIPAVYPMAINIAIMSYIKPYRDCVIKCLAIRSNRRRLVNVGTNHSAVS